ncbi:putative reverse transcriptase domain-containing protein, partial [Tanacetum coccineum]
MMNTHHEKVLKASTSKGAESLKNDADKDENENGSSFGSEDLNFGGFTEEETKVLELKIKKQVGKAIRNGGMMNDFRNEMATYRDFTACDVSKFDGTLDLIACTKWLTTIEGAFRTNCCKEKNKVNFASNFLRDSAKMWWDGKICEKEEFQTLTQTNETVNEIWKKFNDLIHYCLGYHGNEKFKVERFQRMLRDSIREVISPFKCTTLDDLLSRARVREADLLRRKSKETNETNRKLKFGERDAKKPKQDYSRRSGKTQIKTPCKKCNKPHLEECRANLPGCYKCGALNHKSKDCKKQMVILKEEKMEKTGVPNPKPHVYMMATKEDKRVQDVMTGTILVNYLPARVLYDSGASVSFVSHEFSKNLSASPNNFPFPLEVEILDSKVVIVSNVYRDVEIEIDDSNFKIDQLPIMLGVFDIVIGMDWLDKYDANILCSQKLVWVINSQGWEIIICGDRRKGYLK